MALMKSPDGKDNIIYDNIERGIPMAFARFNDGELSVIMDSNASAARGDQPGSPELQSALFRALVHEQDNYYVGLPCPSCFPEMFSYSIEAIRTHTQSVNPTTYTRAVLTTNRNYMNFRERFPRALQIAVEGGAKFHWVCGVDQNINRLRDELGIHVESMKFDPVDTWRFHNLILSSGEIFKPGDIVGISLGPTARVLVAEWFEKYPEVTFLDLGSNYDPITRNVQHRCHLGWEQHGHNLVPPCPECN